MNYLAAPLRRDFHQGSGEQVRYTPTNYEISKPKHVTQQAAGMNPCPPLAGLSAFGGLNHY